jgi:hypothetical protein
MAMTGGENQGDEGPPSEIPSFIEPAKAQKCSIPPHWVRKESSDVASAGSATQCRVTENHAGEAEDDADD